MIFEFWGGTNKKKKNGMHNFIIDQSQTYSSPTRLEIGWKQNQQLSGNQFLAFFKLHERKGLLKNRESLTQSSSMVVLGSLLKMYKQWFGSTET